jgi:squalene-associated FAD-dependent desaturase
MDAPGTPVPEPGRTAADAIVVGAGVAGLAAAIALAQDGAAVTLLERRPFAGGRAYSYPHPALGETIDSQHIVLGCCTNFIELIEQAGAERSIRWYDEICFLEPSAAGTPRRSWIRPGNLPAPAHQAVSFLRAPMLGLLDKAGIAAGLARFLGGAPATDTESFAAWLKRTHQTDRAIRHFWEPIIVGALNDNLERCSVKYAGKVFYESFLRSPQGGRMGIPAAPLSEFFQPVVDLAREKGIDVRMSTGVEAIAPTPDGRWKVTTTGGGPGEMAAGAVVLATSFQQTRQLMAPLASHTANTRAATRQPNFDKFVAAPITTIHLWYDREVTELDCAGLLDSRAQWVFAKSNIRRWAPSRGSYLELVISASWPELKMSREEILSSALREIELFLPRVREARLLKSAVLKEARATFSVAPGLDAVRPPQTTTHPGLYLAGDWTATEWPSTMEGAVRSGRLAAGEIAGGRSYFLASEPEPAGVMRWLSRRA